NKTERYRNICTAVETTTQEAERIQYTIDSALQMKAGIKELMPDWAETLVSCLTELPSLQDCQKKWNDLYNDTALEKKNMDNANRELKIHDKALNQFLADNPQYSIARLTELDKISLEKHTQIQEKVNDYRKQFDNARRIMDESKERLSTLQNMIPDGLSPEDDYTTLTKEKESAESKRDENNKRIGAIQNAIETDNTNLKMKQDTKILDRLKEDYESWNGLNKEFGDKEGKKMRRIAQCCIMENLLYSANVHLHKMAPRYKLLVNPGTLNLKLEDSYNGYSTR
ncbi:exonuclease subunit SbcC, partial [gut metagenome]